MEVDTHLRLLVGAGGVDLGRARSALDLFDQVRAMTWRRLYPRTRAAPTSAVATPPPLPLSPSADAAPDPAGLAYIMSVSGAVMTAGLAGTVTYQVDLAMEPPPVSDLTVNSPPDLAGPWEHRGGAFGQPFYEWNATADLEWVDDGSANPTQGCNAVIGFSPGNIALIDRGNCEFGVKALGAEAVGAIATIIVNNDPAQPLSGILMGAGSVGDQVTIPALMVHYNDGEILRQRILVLGETVNASVRHVPSVGPLEPWAVTTETTSYPSVWAFGTNDPDCCPVTDPSFPTCCPAATSDNLLYLTYWVTAVIFTDGFESGDLSGWSWAEP